MVFRFVMFYRIVLVSSQVLHLNVAFAYVVADVLYVPNVLQNCALFQLCSSYVLHFPSVLHLSVA